MAFEHARDIHLSMRKIYIWECQRWSLGVPEVVFRDARCD